MKHRLPGFPHEIRDESHLDDIISTPSQRVVEYLSQIDGDIAVLGIGGKVGNHVGIMARRAFDQAGRKERTVYGISRFSDERKQRELDENGVTTIGCDLLDEQAVRQLPRTENVIFMAGRKFGTQNDSELTWAMNTLAPAFAADHFKGARFVVFSTGCVYDLVPVSEMGPTEEFPTMPLGEYSNSAVGREQVFSYYAKRDNSPTCLFRLNYSIDLRYGVLRDIGMLVFNGEAVDITMGHVNVIWQGDVAQRALLSLMLCDVPAVPINITGPETASVAYIARRFGELFDREPRIVGSPADTALLSNAAESFNVFGYPQVPLARMIEWTARWIEQGGTSLNKPTHFETRDGRY